MWRGTRVDIQLTTNTLQTKTMPGHQPVGLESNKETNLIFTYAF